MAYKRSKYFVFINDCEYYNNYCAIECENYQQAISIYRNFKKQNIEVILSYSHVLKEYKGE